MDFTSRYKQLNAAQKEAVDTIDGPVMVIAGPGTGKTELLSVRIAAILQKTDTLPENILCLTFTDSGAAAMRERLAGIIGKDAYKVAVHTFHSFGTEVINQNGEYFYNGATFQPADELNSYEIITSIFDELDHDNLLASKMNGEYTHLRDALTVISELKKAGLTSDELLAVLDANDEVIEIAERDLQIVFADRPSVKMIPSLESIAKKIAELSANPNIPSIVPLSRILSDSLIAALDQASTDNSTKPITAWRDSWMTKNSSKRFVLKSSSRQEKLRVMSYVYFQYIERMQTAGLYDFDDMILQVVHAMNAYDDLRYNLQEKYQYILVDEFQDTNLAQMRILHHLTDNPVNEGKPNILVVGDDDQAIYSFQGADISNILDFDQTYPAFKRITLTDNYRSSQLILDQSRSIITQGSGRLENIVDNLSKQLVSKIKETATTVDLIETATSIDERRFVVESIKQSRVTGTTAVLTRRHSDIEALLPYFEQAGIAVNYERRDNVLEMPIITLIEQFGKLLAAMRMGRHDEANGLLPELLMHSAWGIAPTELWQLSTSAYDKRTRWLDLMADLPTFKDLQAWLVELAVRSGEWSLETMLDAMIGHGQPEDGFVSPLYNHFFSNKALGNNPDEYIRYLEALRTIRTKVKEYQPNVAPTLDSFLNYIALHRRLGSPITSLYQIGEPGDNSVTLMTAHKSKGLEFDTVYILSAIDSIWGERARTRSRSIGYPENLPLAPAGETSDERLRLFYVATTRAKSHLIISYSLENDGGKRTLLSGFLLTDNWTPIVKQVDQKMAAITQTIETSWYEHAEHASKDLKTLLAPTLAKYKLSATHLNNFIDIIRQGPQGFLMQHLLHFPSAMSPSAVYGSAIHQTLQSAHTHLVAHKKPKPLEDILHDFEKSLQTGRLDKQTFDYYHKKGIDELQAFLKAKYDSFTVNQKVELSFAGQAVMLDTAHLSGSLDLVDIDTIAKTISVTDYKTGKPVESWNAGTDFEKIKLHKYRQQLLFYRLLINHSRDYSNLEFERAILQFIQPTKTGEIVALETQFGKDEIDRTILLIQAVWQHITELDFPDTSHYDQTYKGILAFEQDLIDKVI
jgi:DNA helicase-2/ATP-dependent DNA helicase PcrA